MRAVRPAPPTLAAALLAAGLLAGCLANDAPAPEGPRFEADWSELALPSGDGHEHADPLQHAGRTTPNFEVLGREPLFSPHYGGQSAGGYVCADAKDTGERRIAAVESRSQVGFALADVTDPAAPLWLGELVMEATYVYDLAVLPGATHVVLVTRHSEVAGAGNIPPVADAAPRMTWRTPCDPEPRAVPWPAEVRARAASTSASVADPVPRPMSLVLVDITDPAAPVVVDQHPIAGYGHSAYATDLGDGTLLLVTTLGPATAAGTASAFELYTLADTPLGPRLEPRSVYRPPGPAATLPAAVDLVAGRTGHDGWLAIHPGTGQRLAYLVGADLLTILDVADPDAPAVVGTWSEAGPGREGYSGVLHSVVPLEELRGGRHYTIVGPEWGGHPVDHPSGIVWVLDTTDPAAPFEVAAWTLPHEVEWDGTYMFSNHYYAVVGETLLVSMYHGGIWAVDLAPLADLGQDAPFLLLDSVGAFLPTDPGADPAVTVRWTPNLQEVLPFDDGTFVTFDSWTGLWTARFDAAHPAPAPEPWPVTPPHAPPG